jgi:hypothetical protein
LGDFDFSINLGVSQSRAGDVVEKHRNSGKIGMEDRRPIADNELVTEQELFL